jgi:hypothetical protein
VVICPSCRNENTEDDAVCTRCGTSLEPGIARLLPPRRTESERPPIEVVMPKQASRWRPFIVLGSIGVLLVGGALMYLLRPNACSGTNFTSANFGYCVLVPEGWEAGPARFGDQVILDQFAPPTSAATVVVASVDLADGAALDDFSEFIRSKDEDAGLSPGPTRETSLGGTDALEWDVTVEDDNGESYHMREIVSVHDDVGWRVTLNDVESDFDSSASALREMLDTWRYR